MKKVLLTPDALKKLKQELEALAVKRSVIAEEIKKARGFGDLSENAEYHAAREAQSLNETEIIKVKALLENYELVDTQTVEKGKVTLNSEVEFTFEGDDTIEKVKVVTKIESDPINNLISNESPIGDALLNQEAGDSVEVQTPAGTERINIISVTHD